MFLFIRIRLKQEIGFQEQEREKSRLRLAVSVRRREREPRKVHSLLAGLSKGRGQLKELVGFLALPWGAGTMLWPWEK